MRVSEPARILPSVLAAWWVRILVLVLLLVVPWWYGSVTWEAQSYLLLLGMVLATSMAIFCAIAYASQVSGWGPNGLTWLLFGLGLFALLQSQPRYPWDAANNLPPSVKLQRWALGAASAPEALQVHEFGLLGATDATEFQGALDACGWNGIPESERKLAISVDPKTTRAASASLFLCGLLVWIGSSLFSQRRSYPVLLSAIAIVGCAIALVGIAGALFPAKENWLGLRGVSSFGTFVSKNTAGAYLNTAIAAGLGLVFWTIQRIPKPYSSNTMRARMPWRRRLIHDAQGLLARVDANQMAAGVGLILLITALLLSQCRGAAVAGLAALLGSLWLCLPAQRTGSAWLGALVVIGLCLAFLVGFQLDERVVNRFETLSEIDLESEMRSGRFYIWGVSWEAARFYGWLGSGLGTFHFASLPFQRPASGGWYYHAESIYAETLVTLGYVGLILMLLAIVFSFRQIRGIYVSERFREFVPLQVAGVYLVLSQSLHGAVDFALIVPAIFVPASLLLGAALGGHSESHRIIRKAKFRKAGLGSRLRAEEEVEPDRRMLIAGAMLASIAGLLALNYGWREVEGLALVESIEKAWDAEEPLPRESQMQNRVSDLVDRCVERGVKPEQSPQLMRLLADAICHDGRMRQWLQRPAQADAKTYWNETSPFVVRIALDRVNDEARGELLGSIGGDDRLEGLLKANTYYLRGQAQSPLDWRLLWGRVTTAIHCKPKSMLPVASILQRTASHLPQLLTSASILFRDVLTEDERKDLWRTAMRTSQATSLAIGRVMKTIYTDDAVPSEIFSDNPRILRRLARDVFLKDRYPSTHASLLARALAIGPTHEKSPSTKARWMADVAYEAGELELEIEHLKRYLQADPFELKMQFRLIERLIEIGNLADAEELLEKARGEAPKDPAIRRLTQSLQEAKDRA